MWWLSYGFGACRAPRWPGPCPPPPVGGAETSQEHAKIKWCLETLLATATGNANMAWRASHGNRLSWSLPVSHSSWLPPAMPHRQSRLGNWAGYTGISIFPQGSPPWLLRLWSLKWAWQGLWWWRGGLWRLTVLLIGFMLVCFLLSFKAIFLLPLAWQTTVCH